MKITRKQFKRVVAEELAAVKKESRFSKDPSWTKLGSDLHPDEHPIDAPRSAGETLGEQLTNYFQGLVEMMVEMSGGQFEDSAEIEEELMALASTTREEILRIADMVYPETEQDAYGDDEEDYWEPADRTPALEGKKKS